jgi:Terminase large subunit, T4likevirus-type, N-terminal
MSEAKQERNVIWTPTKRQAEFLAAPEREALYGGSMGGGKTDCLLACAVSQIENRKHRAIFFRKSFPQLRSAIERSHELFRPLGGIYNIQTSTWKFGSGARIEFAFLDSDSDKFRYLGRQFDTILWDELCEWPNDSPYLYLLSRLRTTKGSGLRLEVRSSGNPLGPGATWVRHRFAVPNDGGASACVDEATGFHRRFIPARIDDNVHLLGSDYLKQLQALPSAQRKALLEGRWDCVSGAVFGEFSHSKHVCAPFPIPLTWEIWRACDDGFRAPACVLWMAHDKDLSDAIYVVAELYRNQMTPELMAQRILQIDRTLQIDIGGEVIDNDAPLGGVIDSSAFSDSGMGSRADEMNKLGCRWKPAEKGWNSRLAGISAIHQRLETRADRTVGLKIFKNCVNLIRTLPALTYDTANGEDVSQNCEDHAFDALRYGLTRKRHWFVEMRVMGI